MVEPLETGPFFHGTRAHLAERDDWTRLTPEALAAWRERLTTMRDENAEIVN